MVLKGSDRLGLQNDYVNPLRMANIEGLLGVMPENFG